MEQRVVNRALNVPPVSSQLINAIRQLNTIVGWIVVLGLVLAFLAGAATARAILVADAAGLTNFFWVLGGILALQSAALVIWLVAMALSMRIRSTSNAALQSLPTISLGSVAINLAQWLAARFNRDAAHMAAIHATARVHASGLIGRWTFSAISHGIWLFFNIGCLMMVIVLLSARQYTFVWETTILSEEHYTQLTRALAVVPEAAGFNAPTQEQIAASQRQPSAAPPSGAREAWSSLLVGSIVVYGFGPRVLLAGLSLSMRRAAKRRYRLDLTQPGYMQLERRLVDQPQRIHDAEPASDELDAPLPLPGESHARPAGSPAIVGVEINQPRSSWPPPIPGVVWDDLGVVENRDDQRRVTARLSEDPTEPQHLGIVCDLATTPDRGIARLINDLRQPLTRAPFILLTGGDVLRSRTRDADQLAQRVADWQQLAVRAGVPSENVIQIDLDNLTDKSVSRLGELFGSNNSDSRTDHRRIEQAFDRIVEHVRAWQAKGIQPDDLAAHVELHRAIAQVYRKDAQHWRQLLAAPSSIDVKNIATTMKSSADRVLNLLPERLRLSPRWLAAGALSGAMGCVAAATLLSPVAIAALPTWSLIGAAIAGVAQPSRHSDAGDAIVANDYVEPVRAASLFALLLDLQGREEAVISQILDRVLEDDAVSIANADEARRLLDNIRHRFDLALAEVDQ